MAKPRRSGDRRCKVIGRASGRMLGDIGKAKDTEEETSVEEPMEEADETSGDMPEEETSEKDISGCIPEEVAEGGEAKGKSPT